VKVLFAGGLDPNIDKGFCMKLAASRHRQRIMELFIQNGAKVDPILLHLVRPSSKRSPVSLLELIVKNLSTGSKTSISGGNGGGEASSSPDVADSTASKATGGVGLRFSDPGCNIATTMETGDASQFRLAAILLEHGLGTNLEDLSERARALLICICAEHGLDRGLSRLLEIGDISKTIRSFKVRPEGWTALQVAAYFGHAAMVDILLSHGWKISDEDDRGRTVLDIAAWAGNVDMVQRLLATNEYITEHRDRNGQTALHYALSTPERRHDNRLLEYLVEVGCGVSRASANGETLLHRAAQFNQDTAATWLLEKGMLPSVTDKYLNTPLHLAAFFKAVSVLKVLLGHGAPVNRASAGGRTPLHCACEVGCGEAVSALLEAGADTSKTDRKGHNALAAAIYRSSCDLPTIEVLLERTEIDWTSALSSHPVATAALALKSPNRGPTLGRILERLRAAVGEKKASRIVKRLVPKLVPEILTSADDFDRGSPADVVPFLLDYLPENPKSRSLTLLLMLVAVIKHGGDDEGHLTRRLLLLDESNSTTKLPGGWGLQHLCCRYGRLKQLRVLLGLGVPPRTEVVIDKVTHSLTTIAKLFSPKLLPQVEKILEGMSVVGRICWQDPKVYPMIRRVIGEEYFEREVIDLSDAWKKE